jgi:2-hydroxymethylglutarate dehydrogenase
VGAVYVDMSTIDPITTRRIGDILASRGIPMLDSPVTKGVKAAVDATLTLLIGGEKSVFETVRHVLAAMGSTLMHLGPLGAGSTTKLVNNMCLGAIVAATAEAMVFGAKLGMDMEALVEAVASGSGSSRALITHIKDFALARRFDVPMFPIHLLMKDLELAINTAKEVDMPLMMTPFCHSLYAILKAKGGGKGFFPEVITVFEEFAGVEAVLAPGAT